ncbi:MAG: hypothetical protein KKA79_04465, partial [Nanoarchaeota archaeon]|nr:hypothetical protein [Nanoarchaeota archaeon]
FINPKIRFKNDLKVRNVALLIDDLIYNGDTIRNTIKEMLMLGYSKNNLYILLEEITSYPFGGLCIPNWNNLNQRNPLGDIVCQPTHKNWYYQK